ncbi:membrane protein [Alicyclobacillus contaminans]|nr:membrane protein [Alicyclobacillus contaminans]
MLVSLVFSVSSRRPIRLPKRVFAAAQTVIGVLIAGTFRRSDMPLLVAHWYAVLLVSIGTLLVSVLIGFSMARRRLMDRPTAFLGVMPGGASGMVAMSSDIDADPKMVALMQYVRLLTVIVSASLVTKWLAPASVIGTSQAGGAQVHAGWLQVLLSLCIGGVGSVLGLRLRLPAGALLGSMALGLVANLSGVVAVSVPPFLTAIAYGVMGIYVGLLFDRASILHAGRLLPTIVLSNVALVIACAAIGGVLTWLTSDSFLTWFLATSPGGLDSVTLMALGSGANVALVVSLQTVRLFAIVFLGPVVVKKLN